MATKVPFLEWHYSILAPIDFESFEHMQEIVADVTKLIKKRL